MTESAPLRCRYFDVPNWGDALNPVLLRLISGREVQRVEWPPKHTKHYRSIPGRLYGRACRTVRIVNDRLQPPVFQAIGSTLQRADGRSEVWGTGFIREDSRPQFKPRRIHAVRGPLTRGCLLRLGIPCPAVYGDPALLLPRFYQPNSATKKRHRLGIIPHCTDQSVESLTRLGRPDDVVIIDINSGIREVVDTIASCEAIASSSLHGLIAADAYGVPSVWIKLSDRVVGNGFKFRDYYASFATSERQAFEVRHETTVNELTTLALKTPVPTFNLEPLIESCPF